MSEVIHVDVRRRNQQTGADTYGYVVEASTDGAPFEVQYFIPLQVNGTMEDCRREAEHLARVFVHACRYSGREVRATSGGYAL